MNLSHVLPPNSSASRQASALEGDGRPHFGLIIRHLCCNIDDAVEEMACPIPRRLITAERPTTADAPTVPAMRRELMLFCSWIYSLS
jgi:hypothetical protein